MWVYNTLPSLSAGDHVVHVTFLSTLLTRCFCVCTQSLSQTPINVNPLHLRGNKNVSDSDFQLFFPPKFVENAAGVLKMVCVRAGASIY